MVTFKFQVLVQLVGPEALVEKLNLPVPDRMIALNRAL